MKSDFPFAAACEAEAEAFLRGWDNPNAYGTKCWYCDARNIEDGSDILLIGLNPGGGDESKMLDEQSGYLELPYTKARFNSWLDEYWPGKGSAHQDAMRRVYQAMYGNDWETALRSSACTNVFPVRTASIGDIDARGWKFAGAWFAKILAHVQPKTIICNGNGMQNSPWAYMLKRFDLSVTADIDIGARGHVKDGVLRTASGTSRVLGLPSLSRFSRTSLYQAVGSLRPF